MNIIEKLMKLYPGQRVVIEGDHVYIGQIKRDLEWAINK